MTRLETLQKENQALRNEIAELKESLQKVSKDLSLKMKSQHSRQIDKKEMSPDRANSVEFMSSKYDELYSFKKEANKQIQDLTAKVNKISEKCERIAKFIEESEAYSYQYNIKIVGVPAVAERETANLVPRLFPLFEERPWSGLVT
jgi:peptidoglycan hydrolase CwlO-like protein